MLKNQSVLLLVRSLCFAGAAAAVTACGAAGTSGSTLPPGVSDPGAVGGVGTLATTSTAAPSVVQSAHASAFAPSSIAVSFPSQPAAGHTLVVALWNNGTTTGAANTYKAPAGWTLVDSNTSHSYHTYELFTHVVASGETNKYVFTPAYAQREHVFMAADVANVAAADKHGNAYVSGTSFATPTLYPTKSGDFALSFNMPQASATWSDPSGWTRSIGPTTVWSGETLTQTLATTSAISERATLSTSSTGFASMVLFAPAQTASPTSAPTSSSTTTSTTTTSTSSSTAPSVAQWNNGSAYAPSALTVKFASAPAAGHLLVVALWNNGQSTGAANTYTAPAGWTLVNQNTSHAYLTYQVFAHVVAAGEANSYAFKPLSAQREHVWIAADTTAASVDKSANAYVSSTAYTTPSLAPAQSNELGLALNLPDTGSSVTWANASGWSLGTGPTSTWKGEALTKAATSTLSESSTLSSSSNGFAALLLLSPGQSSSTSATPAPTAAPTASPTSAPVSSGVASYHGCPLYTANDWFTTNLVTGGSSYVPNTIDPNSGNIISNIATHVGNINFAANVDPPTNAVNLDNESNVIANPQIQGLVYGWANDSYNDDPSPPHIPITSGTFYQEGSYACKESGGDCHVNVLDTVKCVEYETYKSGTYGNGIAGSWNGSTFWAEGGGVENLNHAYHMEPIPVTAADVPMMGTTDWGEDLQYQKSSCQPNCAIPHILAFFLPTAGQANGGYVAPADGEQHACSSYCTYPLPEGARLRLKSSYPCPSPSSYPQANLICNQMKQYGIILNDFDGIANGGGVRLGLSANGSNPWSSSDYDQFLSNVHITNFDVMTLGTIHG